MELMLRSIRKRLGLSQDDVARGIGSTRRIISAYERGETQVPLDAACAMCELFDITLDQLVGRSVERTYDDKGQMILNICYENMNDRGKTTLITVAQSMERDSVNRIEKNRHEDMEDEQAMGA